jgi:hypothetical protein
MYIWDFDQNDDREKEGEREHTGELLNKHLLMT